MEGRIFRTAFGKAVRSAPWLFALAFAACNGGGGGGGDSGGSGSSSSAPTYVVRGTITGLSGAGLTLQNNGGDNLTVAGTASSFQFTTGLADQAAYSVSVLTHPTAPSQTCSVVNGTGTVNGGNVTNVQINCATNGYLVGGTVTGLTGSGLVLQLNGANNLSINSGNPNFTFASAVSSGASYSVAVATQPSAPAQTCSVTNGSGTMGGANVANVIVSCVTNVSSTSYSISAAVSGLTGSGLALRLNGGSAVAVTSDGTVALATLSDGAAYSVVVSTQPSSQTCTIGNSSGTVSGNVTVAVTCAVNVYTVGGTVAGLAGTGLQLQLNGGANLSVSGDGAFTFAGAIADASPYSVSVRTQPSSPSQICNVTNGSGTISGAVTNVQINCTTNSFPVSVTVNGLSGTGLVLQNNGGPGLSVSANGSFAFSNTVQSGATYEVTVATQPASPSQTCSVTNGSGTVGNGSVTNVVVNCATNAYAVGGSVSGLTGSGLVLQLNGSTNLSVNADGNFAFNAIADASAYAVTVATHPSGPRQTCTVTNGAGTLAGGAVTNVAVSCSVVKWSGIKQFGSASDDVVNAVAIDSSGGSSNGDVVVVGCSQGALTGNLKGTCDMPGGNARAYVRKYERTGDFKWERSLGNSANNQANGVAIDGSGNIYVTGISQGTFDGQSGHNDDDIFLTKYDKDGNKLWTGVYGTAAADRGNALVLDASGNLYLAGTVYTTSYDVFVAKFAAASLGSSTAPGTYSLSAQFSSVQAGSIQPNDFGLHVATDASGNVYVSGTTLGSLNGNTNAGGTGNADTFVIRLNPTTLAAEWTVQVGTASYDRNGGVVVDSSGVYVAGSTGGSLGASNPTAGANDLFVAKYDTSGAVEWTHQIVSSGHDHVTGVAAGSGGVYVSGYTYGNFDGKSNLDASGNTTDVFLVKYDSAGTKVWSRLVGTATDDRPYALTTDAAGDPFIAGYTLGALGGNVNAGGADMFIIKYDAAGTRQ